MKEEVIQIAVEDEYKGIKGVVRNLVSNSFSMDEQVYWGTGWMRQSSDLSGEINIESLNLFFCFVC